MKELPKITVITPSYNQGQFLEATIQSVLDQHYPNLQYGIVDGGSTDNSIDIIKKYENKFDFTIIEKDNGQADALNKGFAKADGELICFLNSDDTFPTGTLNYVGRHFMEDPNLNWLVGHTRYIDADNNPGDLLKCDGGDWSLAGALMRKKNFCLPQPSVFWRRKLTTHAGKFDTDLHYCFDYDMWCRFIHNGHKPQLVDKSLSNYRLHEDSKSCSGEIEFAKDHRVIRSRMAQYLSSQEQAALRKQMGYLSRSLAIKNTQGRPWKLLITHPWWLMSEQFRDALLHGNTDKRNAA